MTDRNCANCGAPAPITRSLCSYCLTPLRQGRDLTPDEIGRLERVAGAMELIMKEAEHSSPAIVIAFIALSAASIASYFLYGMIAPGGPRPLVLALLTGVVSFFAFGGIVTFFGEQSIEKKYREDVAVRIDEYLENGGIARYEFDDAAHRTLPKKALLRRYLFIS